MAGSHKKSRILKKRYLLPLLILALIIIARLLLPYFLKRSVNQTLNNIPGYMGHVEDIDVALYRGAYVIEGLILRKRTSQAKEPMLDFPRSDISIEWKSLFKGEIVSEIVLHDPSYNYVFEVQETETAEGDASVDDWTEALKELVPIEINHFTVHNGTASFVQLSQEPDINIFLEQIELDATNLSNVVNEEETLPSNLFAKAVSIGGGDVTISGNLNLLKEIPDMDIEFALENADVTALNDLIRNFVGVDFESGTFELYSEIAIADAYLKGYLKPMFINTKILGEEEDKGFLGKVWEGFVGAVKWLFENQGTDTLATRAPMEGDLSNVDSSTWTTVLNVIKNAWIQAFSGSVDEDIEFEDAAAESN